ncbi:MAG: hypothetical protein WCO98_05245 [bacterium]
MLRHILFIFMLLLAILAFADTPRDRIAFQRNSLGEDNSNIVLMYLQNDDSGITDLKLDRELPGSRITPALSPDGKWLAFSTKIGKEYQLYIVQIDDQNRVVNLPIRLSQDDDITEKFPAWSADGEFLSYFAVEKTDNGDKTSLRIIRKDGTERKILVDDLGTAVASPIFSPDSQSIYYLLASRNNRTIYKVSVTGGTPVSSPKTGITNFALSPDGNSIAALVIGLDGLSRDLWVGQPIGSTGTTIAKKIYDAGGITWPRPDKIILRAARINNLNKVIGFWMMSPKGLDIKTISMPYDISQIASFSVQSNRPASGVEPGNTVPVPPALPVDNNPTPIVDPQPTTDPEKFGPVTIKSPSANDQIHGTAKIDIICDPSVKTVIIALQTTEKKLNPADEKPVEFFLTSNEVVKVENKPGKVSYDWNTQALKTMDPRDYNSKFPNKYKEFTQFPDGKYTIIVKGIDEQGKESGVAKLTVNIMNNIPDQGKTYDCYYTFRQNYVDNYNVHADATFFGVSEGDALNMNASLDVMVRREVKGNPPGYAEFETTVSTKNSNNNMALVYGGKRSTLPEAMGSLIGTYRIEKNGDLKYSQQDDDFTSLSYSQISVPFKVGGISLKDSWSAPLWFTSDILSRTAISFNASHTFDGVEYSGNNPTIRIRSDISISGTKLVLATKPSDEAPTAIILRDGTVADPIVITPGDPGHLPDKLRVQKFTGVRYAWYDPSIKAVVRIEDYLLYSVYIPYVNGKKAYLVRYTYTKI